VNLTVSNFGCAKVYLVHALRILNYQAFGVDLSEYAVANAPTAVREYCQIINASSDPDLFKRKYDWLISKDVFEHLLEDYLRT